MPTPAPKIAPSLAKTILRYELILLASHGAGSLASGMVLFLGGYERWPELSWVELLFGLLDTWFVWFSFGLPLLAAEVPAAVGYEVLCRTRARTPGDRWLCAALYFMLLTLCLPPLAIERLIPFVGEVVSVLLPPFYANGFAFAAVSSWLLHRRRNALFLAASQAAALAPLEVPAASELPSRPPPKMSPLDY